LITHVNGREVETIKAVSKAVDEVPSGKLINLQVRLLQRQDLNIGLTPPRRIFIRKP
jgi:hypothetical protein